MPLSDSHTLTDKDRTLSKEDKHETNLEQNMEKSSRYGHRLPEKDIHNSGNKS